MKSFFSTFSRIDRFLSLYFFYPLKSVQKIQNRSQVSILMYHSISNARTSNIHPYFETVTSIKVFRQQLQFLKDHYTVIDLNSIRKLNFSEKNKKYVVITFDDGYADFYDNAFPLLEQFGFDATVFLPTAYINGDKRKTETFDYLNWDDIIYLSNKNIKFGSHTVSHQRLEFMSPANITNELKTSKTIIEQKTNKKVNSFSYPYAFPSANMKFINFLKKLLKKSMYENCVTTMIGTVQLNDDRYFLKRIPVNDFDDIKFFKAKLENGYNWLYYLQHFKKYGFSRF